MEHLSRPTILPTAWHRSNRGSPPAHTTYRTREQDISEEEVYGCPLPGSLVAQGGLMPYLRILFLFSLLSLFLVILSLFFAIPATRDACPRNVDVYRPVLDKDKCSRALRREDSDIYMHRCIHTYMHAYMIRDSLN